MCSTNVFTNQMFQAPAVAEGRNMAGKHERNEFDESGKSILHNWIV